RSTQALACRARPPLCLLCSGSSPTTAPSSRIWRQGARVVRCLPRFSGPVPPLIEGSFRRQVSDEVWKIIGKHDVPAVRYKANYDIRLTRDRTFREGPRYDRIDPGLAIVLIKKDCAEIHRGDQLFDLPIDRRLCSYIFAHCRSPDPES